MLAVAALVLVALAGCSPNFSPDTYSTSAVQQANKVERGVIVGVRKVDVAAQGAIGAVAGGAAGGALGAQVPGSSLGTTFGVIGGTVLGGLVGTTVEHTTADTSAFEYIVRKPNGDLVSVTQKDKDPMQLGQKVLVIAGSQARIVPDYTVPEAPAKAEIPTAEPGTPEPGKPEPGKPEPITPERGKLPAAMEVPAPVPPPPLTSLPVPGLASSPVPGLANATSAQPPALEKQTP